MHTKVRTSINPMQMNILPKKTKMVALSPVVMLKIPTEKKTVRVTPMMMMILRLIHLDKLIQKMTSRHIITH
jgi:hypothetical protein